MRPNTISPDGINYAKKSLRPRQCLNSHGNWRIPMRHGSIDFGWRTWRLTFFFAAKLLLLQRTKIFMNSLPVLSNFPRQLQLLQISIMQSSYVWHRSHGSQRHYGSPGERKWRPMWVGWERSSLFGFNYIAGKCWWWWDRRGGLERCERHKNVLHWDENY